MDEQNKTINIDINNPKHLYLSYILKHCPDLITKIDDWISSNNIDNTICFKQKLYLTLNNMRTLPICNSIDCTNSVSFNRKFSDGYKIYCSSRCVNKTYRINTDDFKKRLIDIGSNYRLIGEYSDMRSDVLLQCNRCCEKVSQMASKTVEKVLVCVCSKKKCDTNKYKQKLKDLNITDIVLDSGSLYKGSYVPILHNCLVCLNSFLSKPNYILSMNGCPFCKSSKGERIIGNILNKEGIKYIKEYNIYYRDKKYRFDFCLPEYNTIIEYDGIQHFKPIDFFGGSEYYESVKYSDHQKNNYCIESGINIYRIAYYDKDIENSIKNILSIIFGMKFVR